MDEVPLFRRGIRSTLERTGDCLILGESTDPVKVLRLVGTQYPDVVLLGGGLTSVDALEMARLLRQQAPLLGIFILAPSPDEELLFQFIKVGASAYEMRTITPQELVDKVRRVSNGEYLITDEGLWSLPNINDLRKTRCYQEVREYEAELPAQPSLLSPRELEILQYVALGNGNKEIAKVLSISSQTVKNHITATLKKLEVDDRTSAVVFALRQRWIKLKPLKQR